MVTVEELIKDLQKVHPKARVRITDAPDSEFDILSVYEGDDKESIWIDIERKKK